LTYRDTLTERERKKIKLIIYSTTQS